MDRLLSFAIREVLTKLANLVLVTAAISSNLGRVTGFSGATHDHDIMSVTWSL